MQPPNFDKERLYFQEVDAFELLEESPSPKKVGTWTIGNLTEGAPVPALCSRLEKWLHSRRLNPSCGPSSTLSKILDTPATGLETIHDVDFDSSNLRTLERTSVDNSQLDNINTGDNRGFINESPFECDFNLQINDKMQLAQNDGNCEHIEAAVKKLSLTSTSSLVDGDHISPFSALLAICGQSAPSMLQDLFSRYWFVPYFLVTTYLGLRVTKVSISLIIKRGYHKGVIVDFEVSLIPQCIHIYHSLVFERPSFYFLCKPLL